MDASPGDKLALGHRCRARNRPSYGDGSGQGGREVHLAVTASAIREAGGFAIVSPAEAVGAAAVTAVAGRIEAEPGRRGILVNSAGLNLRRRSWAEVDATGFASVLAVDLAGSFQTTAAVLFVARMAARVCINEILVSPTWNRFHIGAQAP